MSELQETIDDLRDLLRRQGFVRCDTPACNCGSWHHRYGLPERWLEIGEALEEAGHPLCNENGWLALTALKALIAERDALREAIRKREVEIRQWILNLQATVDEAEERGGTGGPEWRDAVVAVQWLERVVGE